MVLTNSMAFFDINYNKYASVTGTNLNTSTAVYAYDNRSDLGNVTWTSQAGTYIADYGSGTFFYADSFFINNHNFASGNLQVYTGTSYLTIASFANLTTNAYHYQHNATITAYRVQFVVNYTQAGEAARAGELITTEKRFSLVDNPSRYVPLIRPIGQGNVLFDGRMIWNDRSNIFEADISWEYLQGDSNTLTNTDLQNMTELARRRTSFLFWPNANNDLVNMSTWRKEDVYKVKILDDATYEFVSPGLQHVIRASYKFMEVQ